LDPDPDPIVGGADPDPQLNVTDPQHWLLYPFLVRRRGNDAVMARGTFGNIRLVNKFIGKAAPKEKIVERNTVVIVKNTYIIFC
jgi:hypothetical protein